MAYPSLFFYHLGKRLSVGLPIQFFIADGSRPEDTQGYSGLENVSFVCYGGVNLPKILHHTEGLLRHCCKESLIWC
jgi:hypothetical protein